MFNRLSVPEFIVRIACDLVAFKKAVKQTKKKNRCVRFNIQLQHLQVQ